MGNSLLCHYIDNCFKKGIILWGQKHCDRGAKLKNRGHLPPSSNVKKGSGNTIHYNKKFWELAFPVFDFFLASFGGVKKI